MLKELKENMERTTENQENNIWTKLEYEKLENTITKLKKITGEVQQPTQIGSRKNQWTRRQVIWNYRTEEQKEKLTMKSEQISKIPSSDQ